MDNRTEQLADGVWRIEVSYAINAYLLANDGHGDADGLTLVDSGTRTSGPRLVRSIRMLGLAPLAVGDILLSHWHADHSGSAARFVRSEAAPRVHAGLADLPAVRGDDPLPQRSAAHGDVSLLGRLLARYLRPGPAISGAAGLADGQTLDVAGGVHVVAAPGHTAGHIAFHLPQQGVLLAGDAASNLLWLSRGPGPLRSARRQEASTLRRLAALDFQTLGVGHGPVVSKRARQRLAALADRAQRRPQHLGLDST
ncbi:MAG: MBL fold metallo-hydrolase [Actinomycetota bacterium]|nr:MBL fold metallo-hydrolase [Euzebyaceae bacterium]MBA3621591.1 MBL fold metallo-hydrolase [Euzebyales bacterium]MDQ3452371.1 MBL fold metallo-hydrolase [Actinomycetota bacterium]